MHFEEKIEIVGSGLAQPQHERASRTMCNAGGVISTWAQQDWAGFAAALADGNKAEHQAALQRFLIGVTYRAEELQAHEMAELLEGTALSGDARNELRDGIEFSLGLLAAYHRLVVDDDDEDEDSEEPDVNRVGGPGDLVI